MKMTYYNKRHLYNNLPIYQQLELGLRVIRSTILAGSRRFTGQCVTAAVWQFFSSFNSRIHHNTVYSE